MTAHDRSQLPRKEAAVRDSVGATIPDVMGSSGEVGFVPTGENVVAKMLRSKLFEWSKACKFENSVSMPAPFGWQLTN